MAKLFSRAAVRAQVEMCRGCINLVSSSPAPSLSLEMGLLLIQRDWLVSDTLRAPFSISQCWDYKLVSDRPPAIPSIL